MFFIVRSVLGLRVVSLETNSVRQWASLADANTYARSLPPGATVHLVWS